MNVIGRRLHSAKKSRKRVTERDEEDQNVHGKMAQTIKDISKT